MEFSSRGFQRNNARPATATSGTGGGLPDSNDSNKPGHKKALHKIKSNRPLSVLSVILFVSALILFVAVLLGISTKTSESTAIKKDNYQAVFLNGGQAYFGKINVLNDRYIDMTDLYYISTNGQSGSNEQANISLVKLGSELHCPQDRMIINRDQVLFWENLNNDGKVVKAIQQWQKENPNGQKCNTETTQQQTPAQSQSNTGGSENNNSTANNTGQNSSANNSSSSNNAGSNGTSTQDATQNSTNGATNPSNTPTTP